MSDETVVGGDAGTPAGAPAAADIDEKVFTEAVRRGLITAPQGAAALEEARARGVGLLEVLRERNLLAEEAARDLDEETREDFVPGFRVLSKVGEGGMGVVYRALQKRLDRVVALKVVMPRLAADASYLKRFEREAKAVARLNHPSIVAAYDYGESRGRVFLAMEFVEGVNCHDLVRRRGPLEEERALALVRDVAAGLSHAHAAGIIHRDIKPGNILVADRRPGDTDATTTMSGAKLTDLGLARVGEHGGASDLTAAGAILGTPGYMAPEQAFGKDVDFRADVYALGATLYQLVTGTRPFEATTPVAVIARQQAERLPDPRDLRPDLSAPLVALLQGMLAREREHRYGSYRALLADIDRVRAGVPPEIRLPPEESRTLAPPAHPPAGATVSIPGAPPSASDPTLLGPGAPPAAAPTIPPPSPAAPAAPAAAPRGRRPGLVVAGVAVLAAAGLLVARPWAKAPPGPPAGDGGGAKALPGPGPDPDPVAPGAEPPGAAGDPEPEKDEAEARREIAAGDEKAAIRRVLEMKRRWDGMTPAQRRRMGPKGAERVRNALARAGEALEGRVTDLWKQGEYGKALDLVRFVKEELGEDAAPRLGALASTLESIGDRGPAEREAIRAAREARRKEDPLAALAALEGFEEYRFSPDLAAAGEIRAWAEGEAPSITVISDPPGATLLVGGRDLGRTPRTFRAAAGDLAAELRLEGFRPLPRTLAVRRGGAQEFRFALERLPPADPVPAVLLVPDGDRRPLWTGRMTGAWSIVKGEWGESDPGRRAWLGGEERPEPAAVLRGKAAGFGAVRTDMSRAVRGADGWRLEWQMTGEGRRTGEVVRTELQFAVRADGRALVLGIDDQDAYLGTRDRAGAGLERSHRLRGVEAGAAHTFVVECHGDVFVATVDGKPVGAVAAPGDLAPERTVLPAVEGGVGFFSDLFVTRLRKP